MNAPFDANAVALEAKYSVAAQEDQKRPLYRELPPALDFPIDALGPLRRAAEAIQEFTQAPPAICAQSVMAGATLAAQAHYDVELPGPGIRPLTGIFSSVAGSGDRKSSVDRLATRPILQAEERFRRENQSAMEAYANDKEAWEAARQKAKKKGSRAEIRAALSEIGPEPKPPPSPMLLVADPRPEALVLQMSQGRPWAGVFTAEAGLLIGGAAFNDETRMRTGALLNVLWDGEPIRRTRVGTGTHFLPGRRCSVHLMMQPNVAAQLFGDSTLDGIGTLARTLLVAPESTAGTRLWREPGMGAHWGLRGYESRLEALLSRQPRCVRDNPDVLDPIALDAGSGSSREVDRLPRSG
jgi:hypothetical protein